jgi:hypothetical protein
MKNFQKAAAYLLCTILIIGSSSCLVISHRSNAGGKPGWNKNTNNPHNPNTTNPGKGNKRHK